jgi:hypothetical protein
MPILTDADLRDPSPPLPGDKERAAVAARAHQLGRRRRVMQGAGALGMVAAVAVGVAALTAGGTSGTGRVGRVEAANSPAAEPAPSTFTLSGTVANIPPGVTVTLTLTGSGGTFNALPDATGNFSVAGVPAGTYDASYQWVDTSDTATQAGKFGGVTISGDSTVSFALP